MKPLYDQEKLDRLMEEAGVDLVLAHTPHNLRYLTGGYYFHFRERVASSSASPLRARSSATPACS